MRVIKNRNPFSTKDIEIVIQTESQFETRYLKELKIKYTFEENMKNYISEGIDYIMSTKFKTLFGYEFAFEMFLTDGSKNQFLDLKMAEKIEWFLEDKSEQTGEELINPRLTAILYEYLK